MQASVGVKAEVARGNVLVGGDVAVGEQHAFGLARGAGGVDQRGQIVGTGGARQRIEDRIALGRCMRRRRRGSWRSLSRRRERAIHHDDVGQAMSGRGLD